MRTRGDISEWRTKTVSLETGCQGISQNTLRTVTCLVLMCGLTELVFAGLCIVVPFLNVKRQIKIKSIKCRSQVTPILISKMNST